MDRVHDFLTSMYTNRADFVFTVSRDFVRSIQTPLLVAPDDVPAHPYKVAMEVASLAPNAEVTIYPREGFAGAHRRGRGARAALPRDARTRHGRTLSEGCRDTSSRLFWFRRELPPSESASRLAPESGRRIVSARTLLSCPHYVRVGVTRDAVRQSRAPGPKYEFTGGFPTPETIDKVYAVIGARCRI
jgi:hypothetical protein